MGPWALCPLLYFGSQVTILGRFRSGLPYLTLTYILSIFALVINIWAIQQWFQQYHLSQWLFVPYGLIWGGMAFLWWNEFPVPSQRRALGCDVGQPASIVPPKHFTFGSKCQNSQVSECPCA